MIVLAALGAPAMRQPDGWLRTSGWAWAVVGISMVLAGAAWSTRWARSAAWLAVALAGHACALQLISAPPWDVYQHYLPWRTLLDRPWILLFAGLLLQASVVVWAARQYWPMVKSSAGRASAVRWLVLAAFLGFASALGSDNVPQYFVELTLTVALALVGLINLFLVAAEAPGADLKLAARWLNARFGSGRDTWWNRAVPWAVAVWVFVVTAGLAWVVFDRVPVIQDDVSYLFQAKYFAAGHLYLPSPPDANAFDISHVVNDGTKWFAYGFPGWPAVLAVGVLLGAPWLVNPVLAAVFVLLAHALVRRLYGRSVAHGAVLLLAVSPWFLFMSANYMSHTSTVVWTLLAWLALERARVTGGVLWSLLSGVCLGGLFLTRPLEGILVGAVIGLAALGLAGARLPIRSLAAMILGGVVVGGLVFPYNRALTGDALYTPQAEFRDTTSYPGADRFGFGADIGNFGWPHLDPLPGHGPADVVINLNKNLYQTNFELFGWAFGSLALAALPLVWRRTRANDRLLMAFVVSIAGGHSFYWFSGGPDFGARYWYQLLLPLVVLTVRGVEVLRAQLKESRAAAVSSERVVLFVVAACAVALVNVVPWRSTGKYHRYREMTADVERLAREQQFGRSLVFVRVDDTGGGSIRDTTDYASAFIFNPPILQSDATIYALDAGPVHRQALEAYFPDRPVWTIGRAPVRDGSGADIYHRMQVLDAPSPQVHAPDTPGLRHLPEKQEQNNRSSPGIR